MSALEPAAARHRLLITLNRIGGWANLLAALLLYTGAPALGVPGLAGAPYHEPIIVHCVLTALLLFWGGELLKEASDALTPDGFAVSSLMMIFVATDLQLAGWTLYESGPGTAWAALLAVPAVLCGWNAWALMRDPLKSDPPEDGPHKDEPGGAGARTLLAAERSRILLRDPWENVLYGVAGSFVGAVVMFVPFSWTELLLEAIFDRRFEGWAAFFESVGESFGLFAPFLEVGAIVMLAALGALAADAWLRQRRAGPGHRDPKRDLKPPELEFIEQAARRVREYAAPFKVDWAQFIVLTVFPLGLLAAFTMIGFALSGGGEGLGTETFEAWRTKGLDWYLYIDPAGPGDGLLFVSTLVAVFCIPFILGNLWPRFAVMGTLGFRRNRVYKDDPYFHYRLAVATDVRRGYFTPGSAFDVEQYVYNDFRRFARGWFVFTGILVALNLLFLWLDRMDYDLLTEDYIETTDYWTSKVHRFGYGDVDAVEIACFEDEDYDFELSYVLEFAEGRSVRAIDLSSLRDFREVLPRRLEAWEKVDAKLRAAGVPVRHGAFDLRDCRYELDRLAGEKLRRRILPLLWPSRGGW
ncbi:MAG: hypothetical protein ACLFWF_13530 [Alphaproteobacteria bacterium]